MSRLYGPYSGTLGTILEVDVAPATRVIQVRNDSPNDLLVAFGPADKPGLVTSTQGQWANAVPAWDHPIMPAGPGSSGVGLAAGGAFDGRVYLLPITPPGALATTGSVSLRNSIYVLAFESGDYIPAGSSLPRQHDVTNQTRVVGLPPAAFTQNQRNVLLTAGNDIILRTDAFLSSGPPTVGATTSINIYLYYCYFALGTPSGAGGAAADMSLWVDVMQNATVLLSNVIHTLFVASSNATNQLVMGQHFFQPSAPAWLPMNGFSTAATGVRYRWHVEAVSATVPAAWWNVGIGVDLINPYAVGTHGNFTQDTGQF